MNLIPDAIANLRPGAQWGMTGDVIYWLDEHQTQPSADEIEAEVQRLIAAQPREIARAKRAAAYAAESDPIFFKAQRGEATMDDWRTAVAAIQLSFPYPDEEVTP